MGIKDLWTILNPFCDRKPLYELQGRTVAVDLSCWICEAQNISDYSVQPRMYLRNLYFRTCYLLLMDVTPVFVLEGKAPVLKYQTIADRNAMQFKGAKPKSDKIKTGKDRSRFHFVLKQCEEMLRYMGLVCVQGKGEAEAMCAHLNANDLVSGCISQDSDCFAYGANVVYRNFSISHQGSYSASGGAVDVYDIRKANEYLNFGRKKIIALALLCGSDYNEGVPNIGKDSAIKFFHKYKDHEILDRMRLWRKDESLFKGLESRINDKNICTSCGHFGKIQSHTKSGCSECKTKCGCDSTKFRDERLDIKNELNIRSKALLDPNFPDETLINEFLLKKENITKLDLKWRQPNLINFVKFTNRFLAWEEIYAFEKLLPILTRWQMFNHEFVSDKSKRNSVTEIKGILYPKCIKKIRNPKGIPSYEIIWDDRNKYFEHLIPEEQLDEYKLSKNGSLEKLWSTIEPQNLVEQAYPKLVEEFLETKNNKKKKSTKRPKKKGTSELNDITNQLLNTSISEPKPKRTRKKKSDLLAKTDDLLTKKIDLPVKTIDDYYPKNEPSIDFDALDDDDVADLDFSLVIESIVNRRPKLPDEVAQLGYEIVLSQKPGPDFNETSFFPTNFNEIDLFETTFNQKDLSEDSNDETIEYDVNEVLIEKVDETFVETYIPLIERIKK